MDKQQIDFNDVAHLARLALAGKPKDVQLFVRRLINRYRLDVPELAEQLGVLLRDGAKAASSPLRGSVVDAIPVDLDSRLQLARAEYPVLVETEPVWSAEVREPARTANLGTSTRAGAASGRSAPDEIGAVHGSPWRWENAGREMDCTSSRPAAHHA